jgi:hypothetical protein
MTDGEGENAVDGEGAMTDGEGENAVDGEGATTDGEGENAMGRCETYATGGVHDAYGLIGSAGRIMSSISYGASARLAYILGDVLKGRRIPKKL